MKTEMIPGAILQGAIMGALRMRNLSVKAFSEEAGVQQEKFRAAVFGTAMSGGGKDLREKIINHAGREMVEHLYTTRMLEEADKLRPLKVAS